MTASVAVTGAGGFVGQAVVARLLAEGCDLCALVHNRPLTIRHPALRTVVGGLDDEAAIARLIKGVDVIVHVAGVVRGRDAADFVPVNADGVERVARLAAAQPVPPRVILISSLAAREPGLSHYAASKREGEARLLAAHTVSCTVLRPPAVYGPGDRELLPLFDLMARGVVVLPGTARARASLLHVDDLARAVHALVKQPANGIFELHDGHEGGYDWEEIATIVEQVAGRKRGWRVRLPAPVLNAVALSNLFAARLFGYHPMLTPGKVRELRHPDWVSDNTALSRATGWQPRIPLSEGLRGLLRGGRCKTERGMPHVI